jgi:hypothetical protein
MSWIKRLAVCAAAIGALAVSGATARADYARGYFNNWANDCPLTRPDGGNYYSGTLQAHVGQDAGLKFDLDGNWGPVQWGGTAATAATVNETTGSVSRTQSGNVPMDVTDGYYYTFHLAGDYDWGDRTYLVMKTKYQPASFLSVSDDHATAYEDDVTVTANCSAGTATSISPEETHYIQYTADGWATKHLVAMTGSGLTRRGTIPGQAAGTAVQYIVFSSTMPTNLFTDAVVYSSPANLDLLGFCMLAVANDGMPSSYTTAAMPAAKTVSGPTGSTSVKLGTAFDLGYAAVNFDSAPAWTCTVAPAIADAAVSPASGNATTFTATPETAGNYTLKVIATAGGVSATNTAALTVTAPDYGTCWHIPTNKPAFWDGGSMRIPIAPAEGATNLFLAVGNYQESDQVGNMTSGTLWFTTDGTTWTNREMGFNSANNGGYPPCDKIWSCDLDISDLVEGDTLAYVIQVDYSDHDTTFLGTTNQDIQVQYPSLAWAQAHPFEVVIDKAPLRPGDVYHDDWSYQPWTNEPATHMREMPGWWVDAGLPIPLRMADRTAEATAAFIEYRIGDGAWTEIAMDELANDGTWAAGYSTNAYWTNSLPAMEAGVRVEYYFKVLFTNSTKLGTTYLHGSQSYDEQGNLILQPTLDEAEARGAPFRFMVLDPSVYMCNVWHYPTNYEPWAGAQMREPLAPKEGESPYLRLGSTGEDGEGYSTWITGAEIQYRVDGGAWQPLAMGWEQKASQEGKEEYRGNAYWTNALPAASEGALVEYYFVTECTNSTLRTTYLYSDGEAGCEKSFAEADARANPFAYTVAAAPVLPLANHVWHVPDQCPSGASTWKTPMRNPYELRADVVTNVAVFLGNYQADTDGENMTGGSIFYSIAGAAFTEKELVWGDKMRNSNDDGYLKFWKYDIDTTGMAAGQTLRYYFAARVDGHATTYVISDGGTNMVRTASVDPATDNLFTATCIHNLGNCWHVPGQYEPKSDETMRNPCYPSAGEAIGIYVGNQAWGDGGTPGDMSGGTVYHRGSGETAWRSASLAYVDHPIGNNKYFEAVIPAGTYPNATNVEYYIEVTYTQTGELAPARDTTYLGTDSGARSQAFATAAEAQQHLFSCPIGDEPGREPGFMWHAGNAVVAGTNAVQFWVKIGYTKDGVDWADTVQLRYNFKSGSVPKGAVKSGRTAKKRMSRALENFSTLSFVRDHEEEDPSAHGNAVWWACTLVDDQFMDSSKYLEYEIVAKNGAGNNQWRWADYRTGSATNLFYYTMWQAGSGALTVNGLNADYTTSKFFIDEAAGESVTLEIVYSPPLDNPPHAIEVFSNVGRRDYWDSDIDHNGVVDSIRPPDGDWVVAGMQDEAVEPIHTNRPYFAAWTMEPAGGNKYHATLVVTNCGAYRLTARYKATAESKWEYYSSITNSLRDHAIMVSPKKVLRQNVYEVNGMTAKAESATEAGHSTFIDLIEGTNDFSEFGIPYLNGIQANCLWFQPIHTSSESGLGPGGEPGSPYAAKDYFSVSKWYGKSGTTAGALEEFTNFVAACDAGRSPSMSTSYVGTINIMLDGVFNHTSWDAVFGVMGEQMGIVPNGMGASTAIASVKPGWYANCSDYGAPATWYKGAGWGNHDIACGPDRGDFGKWEDTAELFYGRYSALVRHNPDNNGDYLNEDDQYDYTSMSEDTELLWYYMGSYVPYWLNKTGHPFGNEHMGELDANGIALDDYGIDGLRCDFGQGLPPQFWEYCINRARSKKWNFMFMAESLDGGKVSYRSNRHFDILNESFVFAARNAGSPRDLVNVLNDKKSAYNGGTILLNLTSHDEVMPYNDAWQTASRYAMLATVKGLPMTMYGQEQGIIPCNWGTGEKEGAIITNGVTPGAYFTPYGFEKFELNFGKWVADFKTWNKLTIWENPPLGAPASRGMAQLYGRINWARLNSPALQSDKEYLMLLKDGGDSGAIWAMAKADRDQPLQHDGGDAVLAFVKFINGDHNQVEETFKIADGVDAFLGLEDDQLYMARNIASSDAFANAWDAPKKGRDLKSQGITVTLTGENGTALWDDGALVKFLKIEKYVAPATHDITVTAGANGSVSPSGTVSVVDGEDQAFTITADAGYRIASVLADGVAVAEFGNDDTTYTYTWENVTADGTLAATFVEQTVAPTVVVSSNGVPVEIAWLDEVYGEGQWTDSVVNETGANGIPVWESFIAGLDPTDPDSKMVVGQDIDLTNGVSFKVNVPAGRTAEVCYKDDVTGASKTNWLSFNPSESYSNDGTVDPEWTFIDPTWDGTTIRFYQLQMRMNQ